MIDLDDICGPPAPLPTIAPPAPPPSSEPSAPAPFWLRCSTGRRMLVRPTVRIGSVTDSEGEHVLLDVLDAEDDPKPPSGKAIRSQLHGGPAWRWRIEDADAIAACDAAPHVTDLLKL